MGRNYRRYPGFQFFLKYQLGTLAFLLALLPSFSQQRQPCNTITEDEGFTIRSVKIIGRWVPSTLKQQVASAAGEGQLFHQANLNHAKDILTNAIDRSEEQFPINLVGATSVLYIDVDICDVSDSAYSRQLDLTFHPYYVRIDLYNIGHNLLPIPRSPKPSFYEHVPKSLLILSPLVYISSDRATGPTLGLQTNSDLLQLPFLIGGKDVKKNLALNIAVSASKSLSKSFYDFGSSFAFRRRTYTDSTVGWGLVTSYQNACNPIAGGKNKFSSFEFSGELQGAINTVIFRKYAVGLGYLLRKDSAVVNHIPLNTVNDNGLSMHLLTEGRLGRGTVRTGFWFDDHFPTANSGFSSYQRLSGKIAYGLVLGRGHNNVDFETSFGYGTSWGRLPIFDRYYAGNNNWNFLYESFASRTAAHLTGGALIRGLGNNQGGVILQNNSIVGGTSYWHYNLTFSIPVGRWSKPLIPDIDISDEPRVTLRQALKASVETAKSFIAADLVDNHGYPPGNETDDYVEKLVNRDIRPTLDYLADRANIYSVKPIVLFDLARLYQRDLTSTTFVDIGGGVQITIVNASLQLGYAHIIRPKFFNGNGNFLLRLTMQNFF